jgi:hypothetical protein
MRQLFRNRRGIGPIGAIMLFCVFLVIYFVWLAGWVSEAGTLAIQQGSMTGFEAFFYANLNLWIVLAMILGMLGWAYFGGQQ